MKICVSSLGKEKTSMMDDRFGRCQYFFIVDTQTNEEKVLENKGLTATQGAGIAAGQQIVDEKVDVLITGYIGPNAMKVLQGSDIKIYKGKGLAIQEEIDAFKKENLDEIKNPGPAHFGMKNQ
ncbi:NifB/NifX family molybdenum-iron cluster-binding protein [Inediibacterium massiliense]|uniref:NifB/NifX family molybdenum-iron cluster-binding protein n=1 Tax=Inediibacterium massiliense TaxID=1658111 RepID=UPI0006B5BEE6|nr:NifB/NifX family molybdenum-iron cluster-binding protein [Inediibacterium massiliense]